MEFTRSLLFWPLFYLDHTGWFIFSWTHCKRMKMFYILLCAICNQCFNLFRDLACMFFSLDYCNVCQLQVEQEHFFKRKYVVLILCWHSVSIVSFLALLKYLIIQLNHKLLLFCGTYAVTLSLHNQFYRS